MIRRPPRSTLDRSSAASDVYKRQTRFEAEELEGRELRRRVQEPAAGAAAECALQRCLAVGTALHRCSDGEGLAAAAALRGVRIAELEAAAHQVVLEVDLRPEELPLPQRHADRLRGQP